MKKDVKNLLLIVFVLLLLLPVAFAAIWSSGSYNSWTKSDFIGYSSDSDSGHESRESGDQVVGLFSISTYLARLGILKYCGNSIVDSGEDCDGTNLNGETCSSQGYTSGTLACNSACSFDTSGCTSAAAAVEVGEVPSGSFSGETPPRTTKRSVGISGEEIKVGTLQLLTTNNDFSVSLRGEDHRIDVKQITADSVVLWIYSEPVEVFLNLGEHKRVDLDGDGFGDIWIELKDIRKVVVYDVVSYEAVIFFKEMSPVTGAVVREEEIEVPAEAEVSLPKITFTIKDNLLKPLGKYINNFKYHTAEKISYFNKVVKQRVDIWINKVKKQKSWLIPSLAAITSLLIFFVISFRFYLKKKSKGKPERLY